MGTALCLKEWVALMEGCEAFSIILPPKPQSRTVIILTDCRLMFNEEDLEEIISVWKVLDNTALEP